MSRLGLELCPLKPHRSQACWYSVQTKPRQEAMAELVLQRAGVETFYPKISSNKALFPSYIFAKFSLQTQLRRVKYAQGVRNIVEFGGIYVPVEDSLLDAIRLRMKEGLVVLEPVRFKRGEQVFVNEGPLEGINGIFDSVLNDKDRVVILLDTLAGQGRLVLSSRLLKKAS